MIIVIEWDLECLKLNEEFFLACLEMGRNVLLIGGGGREHAIAWKLAECPDVNTIFVAPGNAGTACETKCQNVNLDLQDHSRVADWCKQKIIDLVVIGPEAPLAEGIVDNLMGSGISCFGPTKLAAQIESDKAFSKDFMDRHGIPTAKWKSFKDCSGAINHITNAPYDALVVKAAGLAAGKGVIVAEDQSEAINAVKTILQDKKFGSAGETVVVEEKLCGEEISVLGFSDGNIIVPFPPAQDHKRLLENDKGPNTGGMGAYCPVQHVPPATLQNIHTDILQKVVSGMKAEGIPFVGVLYAGLMLTNEGPKVLEFNCRFGDPETEVLLPLLEGSLFKTMQACANGNLQQAMPSFKKDLSATTVVLASGGYPGSYKKGCAILGLEAVKMSSNVVVFHAGTKHDSSGGVCTSGGRVLAVTGFGRSPEESRNASYDAISKLSFENMVYRKDIATKSLRSSRSFTYLSSGVNIDAGMAFIENIKPLAKATARKGCDASLGGFGGLFDLAACKFKDPVLVSGTDGVGTKLEVAQACNIHSSIGIDLVAMCVNDILASGAEPLFFLDYFACGKLDNITATQVVAGISQGCTLAGCALLGGETAEMPGMYREGAYDLAGFAVGAVEKEKILQCHNVCQPGDIVLGLSSSGLHSNGYSLVRKIITEFGLNYHDRCPFLADSTRTLGEELLTPTKIYVKSLLGVIQQNKIKGFAHITGGGLLDNIPRILPKKTGVVIDANLWKIPPVFAWLQQLGKIDESEMLRTFNCGIGAVVIVEASHADDVITSLREKGEDVCQIGTVVSLQGNEQSVAVKNFSMALSSVIPPIDSHSPLGREAKRLKLSNGTSSRMRVGVLISGTGTNLQALIDKSILEGSHAEIVLVLSNVEGVKGLERAQKAGIPTKVVSHKGFKKRVDFDMTVDAALRESNVELVCLAGFMRILTGDFVRKWKGKLINVHPSLLPSFKGMHAHRQVLEAGVRISGCTVHFVEEEVDAGGIIVQESVPVYPSDSEETLQERVKTAEHKAFPLAMELIASGQVRVSQDGKVQWKITDNVTVKDNEP